MSGQIVSRKNSPLISPSLFKRRVGLSSEIVINKLKMFTNRKKYWDPIFLDNNE